MSGNSSWQVVPYEGKTVFKRVRIRDEDRVRDVVRHLQAHECVALIGPPFSEKSRLLGDVAAALRSAGRYMPLYLDLWRASSHDETAFFTSLAWLIHNAIREAQPLPWGDEPVEEAVALPASSGVLPDLDPGASALHPPPDRLSSAHAFQNYLLACVDAQPGHLVLLIDHLQALPHDLVHSLLLALRASYMERAVDAPRQLAAVVTGGMNLVGLSAGATSPFNIARPVLASPLSADQSRALAEATLQAYGCTASPAAIDRLVQWGGGDRYLLPRLCAWSAELVKGYRRNLVDRRVVDRAAERLFPADSPGQAPLREAIRVVEEDADTLVDVLRLLQEGRLARSRAHQMPTRTGADRLQLSGAFVLVDGYYTLKNEAYHQALVRHFSTERVGHILRIAGRWQEAISYLAPQLQDPEQGRTAQSQLLEATVQSIYASDSLARSYELLAGGLSQGFGLPDVVIYRAIPARGLLEPAYSATAAAETPASISLRDTESVEARTFRYGRYALRSVPSPGLPPGGTEDSSRLIVALSSAGRRLGLVAIERFAERRDPREMPSELPDLLHFLEHAASAIENVVVRAAYREIGQAVLDASALQPTLERVLEVVSEALGCTAAHLYLLDRRAEEGLAEGMLEAAAGIGQAWHPDWQALARYPLDSEHPAAQCLRDGRMRIVSGSDERLNQAIVARFGLHGYTWAFLPLQAAGRPLGVLALGYADTFRLLPTQEYRTNLAAFADQVAIAVHNMQLLRRTDEALSRRAAELDRLRSSSLAVSAILDVPDALDRIIWDLRALFPGTEVTIWDYDRDRMQLSVCRSSLTDSQYLATQLSLEGTTGRAVTTGQVQLATESGGGQVSHLGLKSLVTVPMVSHDRILGAIDLYVSSLGPALLMGTGAIDLIEAFAAHAAVAIDNARLREEEIKQQRLAHELAVARQIQRSLLPTGCPQPPGWQFAAAYRSARVVGGDFYDFYELPGDSARIGILIADVTDKGIPAALFMALSRTILRTMALSGRGPAAVLTRANDLILSDSRGDVWLTAAYGALDLASGRLIYANGGHCRPLWYRAVTGEVTELNARGILLGAFDEVRLEEQRVDVQPGDALVFFTDGITDALSPDGDTFGDVRLFETLAAHGAQSAEEILDAIVAAANAFAAGAEQADDITCVVVKRAPGRAW